MSWCCVVLDFCFSFDSLYDGMVFSMDMQKRFQSASLGQSKYMILSYFMKGTSIRCFWLLDYDGANADLSNGLCFVQIWSVLVEILAKIMSMENWTRMANFALPWQAKKLADNFLVRRFLFISLRRVKLELPVRAQRIGNSLLYNSN